MLLIREHLNFRWYYSRTGCGDMGMFCKKMMMGEEMHRV